MTLILDAGALVALERGDRDTWRLVNKESHAGRKSVTHGGVLAQAWRGGSGRQARLALSLRGISVLGLDERMGRAAGVLMGKAQTSDAIDAALVVLAEDGDQVVTSDPLDIAYLALVAGKYLDVIPA